METFDHPEFFKTIPCVQEFWMDKLMEELEDTTIPMSDIPFFTAEELEMVGL